MKRNKKVLLLIIGGLFLFSTSGFAEHFIFNVPVKLENLCSGVDKVTISIWVSKTKRWNSTSKNNENRIGYSPAKWVLLQNGNRNIVTTIKFDANANKNPGDARSYLVEMHFHYNGSWYTAEELMKPDGPCPQKPGTPLVTRITGTVKHQFSRHTKIKKR
jgi:hypothetical protein